MPVAIPFNRQSDFVPGRVDRVAPGLRRVLCPNPGPFTFMGTNTYIVGEGTVALIDPGPDLDAHRDALLAALKGETVSHILVTHTHRDHSPLAAVLKAKTGARTGGYGPHGAGKAEHGIVIEEGGDMAFVPDLALRDGDRVTGPGWTIEAVYTPGHCSNHLCFSFPEARALLTGDHVMSWSTTIVAPPDGDMGDYMASLDKLRARADAALWPAHGGPVQDPHPFLDAYYAHREEREAQILRALLDGPSTIPALVKRIYAGTDPRLHPAAGLSVQAHLIGLVGQDRVSAVGGRASLEATYRLSP